MAKAEFKPARGNDIACGAAVGKTIDEKSRALNGNSRLCRTRESR